MAAHFSPVNPPSSNNSPFTNITNDSSFADSMSADSDTVLIRNRSLWKAISGLKSTFHACQNTMEELVETPLQKLSTHTDMRADKASLKDSEKILKKHVLLLKDGVKTIKVAMTNFSKKIDEFCTQGTLTNVYSFADRLKYKKICYHDM